LTEPDRPFASVTTSRGINWVFIAGAVLAVILALLFFILNRH